MAEPWFEEIKHVDSGILPIISAEASSRNAVIRERFVENPLVWWLGPPRTAWEANKVIFFFKFKNRNTASLHQRSRAGQNKGRLLDSGSLLVWNEPTEPNGCKRVLAFKKREKWLQRQIRVQWAYLCCHGHGWKNQPVTSPPGARSPAQWARGHSLDLKRIILQASKFSEIFPARFKTCLGPMTSFLLKSPF